LQCLSTCVEDITISSDLETEVFVKKHFGPHEFFFLLEGVETLWLSQKYLGNCTYEFPVQLFIPTPRHRLYLVQLRDNFWGFNEFNYEGSPKVRVVPILIETYISLLWHEHIRLPESPKACGNIKDPLKGRYVTNCSDCFEQNYHLKTDMVTTDFFIDLRNATSSVWTPYSCSMTLPSLPSFLESTEGKKIDFVGDSHMRFFFNYALQKLCGLHVSVDKLFQISKCYSYGELPDCPKLSVCLVNSPFLTFDGTEGNGKSRDLLIINSGNHPAASAHWSLKQFASKVNETLEKISLDYPTIHTFWLGQFPIPFRTDEHIRQHNDARTFTRMELFEQVTKQIAQPFISSGILSYVDVFPLAMTAIHWSSDNAHLLGVNAALDGILRTFLLQLQS
jgi:hypothetical protein